MAERNESYEQLLIENVRRVLDFQRFAEAKNAAPLALASAWLVAGIDLECKRSQVAVEYEIPDLRESLHKPLRAPRVDYGSPKGN